MIGLLLDLDRTLVDLQTFTDYEAALTDLEKRFGNLPGADVPATYWRPATLRAMEVLTALSGDDRWQQASDIIERHELAAVRESVAMPGLGVFLDAIADVPVAVVTLCGAEAARRALERHGIDIPLVIGRRLDLRPKPAPDQILAGATALDMAPNDLTMIGDSSWDRDAALAAGAGFVGVGSKDFGPETPVAATLDEVLSLL
jgi:phosphoglycolate phosphatase-like HAD superfamily hydrolase